MQEAYQTGSHDLMFVAYSGLSDQHDQDSMLACRSDTLGETALQTSGFEHPLDARLQKVKALPRL